MIKELFFTFNFRTEPRMGSEEIEKCGLHLACCDRNSVIIKPLRFVDVGLLLTRSISLEYNTEQYNR